MGTFETKDGAVEFLLSRWELWNESHHDQPIPLTIVTPGSILTREVHA